LLSMAEQKEDFDALALLLFSHAERRKPEAE
jgi:hypothetical protein